jgi:two-component system OmpR family response regulator
MEEVIARVRAIVRRAGGFASSRLEIGDLVLDLRARQLTRNGDPVSLTPQEYKLVAYLAHQRGRVCSQLEITEHLYSQDFERDSNAVEVLVGRVRRKLGSDVIKTRRGFGYFLEGLGA